MSLTQRESEPPGQHLTVAWLKAVLRELAAGTARPEDVIAAIEGDRRRLWRWPEFRELRGRRLGEACSGCGSAEDLVLQHTIQPRHPGQIRVDIEREFLRRLGVDVYGEYARGATETYTVASHEYMGCAVCTTRAFYERRVKRPRYRCTNGHTFEVPTLVGIPEHEVQIPFKVFASERTSAALRAHRAEIEHKVARSAAQQLISYFSGHGVTTACKRCAYRFDARRKELAERTW